MFGLKTCDTCRKALKWASDNDLAVEFVDVRRDGISPADIEQFVAAAGWQAVLNRNSTTWRSLDETERAGVDQGRAVELITRHPTLMKRPVFLLDGEIVVGFDPRGRDRLEHVGKSRGMTFSNDKR